VRVDHTPWHRTFPAHPVLRGEFVDRVRSPRLHWSAIEFLKFPETFSYHFLMWVSPDLMVREPMNSRSQPVREAALPGMATFG